MKDSLFDTILSAYVPTAVRDDGAIDTATMADIIDRVAAQGVRSVTLFGSSGELPMFNPKERASAIAAIREKCDPDMFIVAGVSGFESKDVGVQAHEALSAGADTALIVPLAYFPLKDADIVRFVSDAAGDIADSVILYNHPKFTHVDLVPAILAELSVSGGFVAVKESSGVQERIPEIIERCAAGMRVFSATAVSPVSSWSNGASGWMSGPAAAFPDICFDIMDALRNGDVERARATEARLAGVIDVFRTLGPSTGTRALFASIGFDLGRPRLPLPAVSPDDLSYVKERIGSLLSAM